MRDVLLMPWCHLWAEPAEDSEDEEEEEEVESKDPPKKLKKKLPKEPPSGESREKKLKPKGECPGDGEGLYPEPCPLASILAGTRGPPASRPHRVLGGSGGCGAIASSQLDPSRCPHPATSLFHHHPSLSPSPCSSIPPGDKSEPDGKAKSAKSTKKEPMSMFQVNGEKKEKKSKKKGMG